MPLKDRGSSLSLGTVLSVVCLLLYSGGFITIELKFNDHARRLEAVEEVVAHMKQGMAKENPNEGKQFTCVYS